MLENLDNKQLKNMSIAQLENLCDEIRQKILSAVFKNGGHLSSNLGAVELTVALHRVFDLPKDKIIFDVGHQCYPHKLLSGRYDKFDGLRKKGGISGFPKREESEFDCYNTGHAGTSISAALGIAKARDIANEDFNVIAIIGDGSFNNGLVYEAFNSLKLLNTRILVILNDNGMSIAPTVGSMHDYLEYLSHDGEQRKKRERHANIFERFGFCYDGVYDGNNLSVMVNKLEEVKEKLKTQSVILHVVTKKGKGYDFCEENPEATHGISISSSSKVSTEYSQILGKTLCELAERDKRMVAVTAAMTSSLGLSEFFEKFPERAIDVGICEEHATILCASMAMQNLKPYYAVYSTFLQRSYDEIMIDIGSQNLPVTICVDRAGISGSDGETHQGVFDLSFLSHIPNITVAVPKDTKEFEEFLKFSVNFNAPLAIRYPREGRIVFDKQTDIELGKWEVLNSGSSDYVIISCGERAITISFAAVQELKKLGINVKLINARFVKPMDYALLDSLKEKRVITVEDNMLLGGFGSLVDCYFSNKEKLIKNFAYADEFIPHGGVKELMTERDLSCKNIVEYILNENR